MKRALIFLLTMLATCLLLPKTAFAVTPDLYALQVLQRDLPQSMRWLGRLSQANNLGQAEVYELYHSALSEAQANQQSGISVKGSIERMLLLMEGARYFEQIQQAPLDFQNKKESSLRLLQAAKDQLDRTQFGEDPQVLLEEWQKQGFTDFAKNSADLVEVFTQVQKLLSQPVIAKIEQNVDAQAETESNDEVETAKSSEVTPVPTPASAISTEAVAASSVATTVADEDSQASVESASTTTDDFEKQRFASYVESAESGKVAEECKGAAVWQTEKRESCQSDDSLECDRSYARQCKKLQ